MASIKSRLARAGVKYLVTHPRGRVTHFVVRFAVRKVSRKVSSAPGIEAIPAVRGSRLTTLAGVAGVAGVIIVVVRRQGAADSAVPPAAAPFPPTASSPPGTPAAPSGSAGAPSVTSTTSEAADAVAAAAGGGDDDEALVTRVEAKLLQGASAPGLEVEANAGVITLRGQVPDEEAESRFVRDAEQVAGVKAVQSELQTSPGGPEAPAS